MSGALADAVPVLHAAFGAFAVGGSWGLVLQVPCFQLSTSAPN